jgi:hypothetical protein
MESGRSPKQGLARSGKNVCADFFHCLIDAFGADRLMWGSNFPASNERSYRGFVELAQEQLAFLSAEEQRCSSARPRSAFGRRCAKAGLMRPRVVTAPVRQQEVKSVLKAGAERVGRTARPARPEKHRKSLPGWWSGAD